MVFPTRWAMAALGSSIGLYADTIGGDRLFGDDSPSHSTLYPVYRQADATQRLLLCSMALGALLLALVLVIGRSLHREDLRV